MSLVERSEVGGVRPDETVREACHRVAVDAVYSARDSGGTMHDAGQRAADAVLEVVLAQYPEAIAPRGLDGN